MATSLPISKNPSYLAPIVERYFQVSLYLLIVTGFVTLSSTGKLDPLSLLFVAIALIARAYLLLKKREFKIPERWTTYFTLIYVLVFVADLFMVSGDYVTASVHLVLFSLVVKIFSVQRERDNLYLALLSFLAVLAASVLTVDTLFLGAFIVFILLAVNTFVSMEIRRSLRNAQHLGQAPVQPTTERQMSLSLSSLGGLMVLGIVLASGALFFVLPRFSGGYFSAYAPRNDLVTGFSDQVTLGAIGRIQQSDSVVMHVQMESNAPPDLKFRGLALNMFDGRKWINQTNTPESIPPISGRFLLRAAQIRKNSIVPHPQNQREFRLLRYRVIMEPLGTNVLFAASVPVEIGARFRELSIDEAGSIYNVDRNRITDTYEAVSQIPQPSLETLKARGETPAGMDLMYLQLPELDPRVKDLAEDLTKNAKSSFEKAEAIELYLRENFKYTLQLPDRQPKDSIAYFLFERKQGHCEYFASSMAVMLRSVGVPSRIVNGFRNGEYNDLTGSYIIRARNAHAWVEAYLPGAGWTEFDPTPADPAAVPTTFSRMQLYLDAAQEFWREWIINYDFGHQRELTLSTAGKAQRSAFEVRRWLSVHYRGLLKRAQKINGKISTNPVSGLGSLGLAGLLIAILWNFRWLVTQLSTRWIARKPSKSPQAAATIWYSRMLKAVERKGYEKPENLTATEFTKRILEPQLHRSVANFTERYERARFGDSADDAGKLPELYEEIKGQK